MEKYIVCSDKPWGWNLFKKVKSLPGMWYFSDHFSGLERLLVTGVEPRYIFFAHWSGIVPDNIINNFECVCFHPTPLPIGRGGTPIQNQILQDFTATTVTAFRMTDKIDAGPIYGAYNNLSLSGSAEEIYLRMMNACYELINWMVLEFPTPEPQIDVTTVPYKRRKPEQSEIPSDLSVEKLFDYIRMLDAEGYPLAYIDYGDYRIEFKNASLRTWGIEAQVKIWKR